MTRRRITDAQSWASVAQKWAARRSRQAPPTWTHRALFAAIAAFLPAGPALAWTIPPSGAGVTPTESALISSTIGAVSTGANPSYIPIGWSALPTTTDSNYSVFAAAGTIKEIRVRSAAAPTGAQTWTGEVMKNGSATGFNCAITSGSSQKCATTGGSVSFAAGDYGSIRITPASSPTVTRLHVVVIYEPTTANDTLLFGQGVGFSTSATQGVSLSNNQSPPSIVANRRYNVMPTGGTIDRFFINSNAPGAGTNYAYTVDKTGSTTALTAAIADTATAANDTTHSFSVTGSSGATAGDDLVFQAVPTGTPATATAGFGVRFIPSCAPCFPLIGAFSVGTHATNTFYYPLTGGYGVGTATETNSQNIGATMTITAIAVKITAPGAGKNFVFTLRKNAADTGCTVTISDTAIAGIATCSEAIANDDLLSTSVVPTGTPTTSNPAISYLATR